MKLKAFLLAAFFAAVASAQKDLLALQLRYHSFLSQNNTVDETAFYFHDINDWLQLELAARLGESGFNISSFSYKGDLVANYLYVLQTRVRVNATNSLLDGTGTTTPMAIQYVRGKLFGVVELFAGIGWQFRFTTLSGAPIFPALTAGGMDDQGYVADIGFGIFPIEEFSFYANLSSYEEIAIFNIHNPFVRVEFDYLQKPQGITYSLIGRYRILLGFGRMDDLMIGVGVKVPMSFFEGAKSSPPLPSKPIKKPGAY